MLGYEVFFHGAPASVHGLAFQVDEISEFVFLRVTLDVAELKDGALMLDQLLGSLQSFLIEFKIDFHSLLDVEELDTGLIDYEKLVRVFNRIMLWQICLVFLSDLLCFRHSCISFRRFFTEYVGD